MMDEDKKYFIRLAISLGASLLVAMVTHKIMGPIMEDMMRPGRKRNKDLAFQKLIELGIPMDMLYLNKHETDICSMIVVPSSIDVTWDDIAGLDTEIQTLKETVILPIIRSDIFNNSKSKLLSFPKGVLLSGPPGTGKTMIAKATAKESGCLLINIDISMIHDMWVGESPKFVQAIFTLAEKLNEYAPVIVFIDEIDTLLASRTSTDHENTSLIKGTFMTKWDGLISSKDTRIIVMGATNKPEIIDKAVYRRMPIRFHIGMPNKVQRKKILHTLLIDEELDSTVDVELLSAATNNMSGSDLKEYCSQSCMVRYRETFREHLKGNKALPTADQNIPVRAVNMADFVTTANLFGENSLKTFFRNNFEVSDVSVPLD